MDREIALPFRIDNQGRIATLTDPNALARQHLTTYLLTSPMERVMRPDFGTPVRQLSFENLDPVQIELLTERVRQKVGRDVPNVRLVRLLGSDDSDQAAVRVTVEFAVAQGPAGESGVQTTTIELRGGEL